MNLSYDIVSLCEDFKSKLISIYNDKLIGKDIYSKLNGCVNNICGASLDEEKTLDKIKEILKSESSNDFKKKRFVEYIENILNKISDQIDVMHRVLKRVDSINRKEIDELVESAKEIEKKLNDGLDDVHDVEKYFDKENRLKSKLGTIYSIQAKILGVSNKEN